MPASISSEKFLAKLRYVAVFLFVFGIIYYASFFLKDYFQIKNIEVTGSEKSLLGLKEIQGKNMFFISEKETRKIIKEKNPSVKEILFERKYPSTLVFRITLYKPVAELAVMNGFYDLAETGKIIYKSRKENSKLPRMNFYQKFNYQSYRLGDTMTFREITDGLYFLKSFADLNIKVDSLDISGINMLVFNLENKKIIFDSVKEKELQVFQMQEITRRFKVEGKQYKEIDLRYDKPIIRF